MAEEAEDYNGFKQIYCTSLLWPLSKPSHHYLQLMVLVGLHPSLGQAARSACSPKVLTLIFSHLDPDYNGHPGVQPMHATVRPSQEAPLSWAGAEMPGIGLMLTKP